MYCRRAGQVRGGAQQQEEGGERDELDKLSTVEIGHLLLPRSVLLNQIFSTHLLILVTQSNYTDW